MFGRSRSLHQYGNVISRIKAKEVVLVRQNNMFTVAQGYAMCCTPIQFNFRAGDTVHRGERQYSEVPSKVTQQ